MLNEETVLIVLDEKQSSPSKPVIPSAVNYFSPT